MDRLDHFSTIADKIVSLLLGRRQLALPLADIPHTAFCDLFQVYAVLQEEHFMLIRSDYLRLWQTDAASVHRFAQRNSPALLGETFQTLQSVIGQEDVRPDCAPELYVLSNPAHAYGASSVLYPGTLERIGRELDADLYLLPASVHEMILVPAREIWQPEELVRILRANNRLLAPAEFLSDSLYRYSLASHSVSICRFS